MAVDHYENFPVASCLCPAPLRPAVQALYWFARTADDLADEGDASPEQRLADLAAFEADLLRMAAGQPVSDRWPGVFTPLAVAVARHGWPLGLMQDLLSAFRQDVTQHRYSDREQLLDYCRRSANPIGRALLHLYGVQGATALSQSDAICSALQLINFWQDLSIDLPRDRLYLPDSDIARHGLSADALLSRRDGPAARALVADVAGWARELMTQGAPLVHVVPGRLGWELRLVVQGGLRILDHLATSGHAALVHRPKLTARDLPVMAWRAWRMSAAAATRQ